VPISIAKATCLAAVDGNPPVTPAFLPGSPAMAMRIILLKSSASNHQGCPHWLD